MSVPSELQDMLQDFLTEAGELLDGVDVKLIELEHRKDDAGLLNEIFRGFHTIKGGAGFLEAQPLVDVCHRTESLFDQLRSGKRFLSPEMLDVIMLATAAVRRMFDEMAGQGDAGPADPALLESLSAWVAGDVPPANAPAPSLDPAAEAALPASGTAPAAAAAAAGDPDWHALYGALTGVPSPAIAPPTEPAHPAPAADAPHPAKPAAPGKPADVKDSTLRIDIIRFDQILNLSGEIGLVKNRLARLRSDLMGGKRDAVTMKHFDRAVSQLTALVGDLQNTVMKARMQPVGRVFQKYVRIARDLSRQLGKDVDLVIEGETTEIDKTMLDLLNDPLTHLVRNAVDHGVDSPAERAAAGKSVRSEIKLSAQQVGDRVMIEIADDGRGMRPEVLRDKAVEKGLITLQEASMLDDAGALNLIFLPGFSTKTEISGVSGRGVGMDVVKTNITKLNGRIQVFSVPGRGTRVVFALPLTLAILPVLVFRLTKQPYALPLRLVREIIRLDASNVQLVADRPSIIMRGEVLPVIALADLLKTERGPGGVGLVIQDGVDSLVLAVDGFIGQDEVVIKALDKFRPKGVAGATQSGDGALVLVLDLSELLQQHGWKVAA